MIQLSRKRISHEEAQKTQKGEARIAFTGEVFTSCAFCAFLWLFLFLDLCCAAFRSGCSRKWFEFDKADAIE
ncbi:MAG: hypothetical protein M3371_00350, partial [Acidobacteriota bacterium]|nr:hypothetical protein [Acidobacteriota bacterium]